MGALRKWKKKKNKVDLSAEDHQAFSVRQLLVYRNVSFSMKLKHFELMG